MVQPMSLALLFVPLVVQLVSCRSLEGKTRVVKYPQSYSTHPKGERWTAVKHGEEKPQSPRSDIQNRATSGQKYTAAGKPPPPFRYEDKKLHPDMTNRESKIRAAKLLIGKPNAYMEKGDEKPLFKSKVAPTTKASSRLTLLGSPARQNIDSVEVASLAPGGDYLTSQQNIIQTANFPDNYPDSYEEEWLIEVDPGRVVSATFHTLDIEYHTNCDWDSLTIYDGATPSANLLTVMCGTLTTDTTIYSSGRFMYLVFSSDFIVNGQGFKLTYVDISPNDIPDDPVAEITELACSIQGPAGLSATDDVDTIMSPGGVAGSYPNFAHCEWRITAAAQQRISLKFLEFSVEYALDCIYDSLTIYEGMDADGPQRGAFCGYSTPYDMISYGRYLYLVFSSDDIVTSSGFTIEFQTTDLHPDDLPTNACPGPELLESPGYPVELSSIGFDDGQYRNDESCSWEIIVAPDKYVKLEFQEFGLEFHQHCDYDELAIFDGANSNAPVLARLCGHQRPDDVVSTTNQLFLHFRTDYSVPDLGFRLEYSESDEPGVISDGESSCPGPLAVTPGDRIESPGYDLQLYPNSAECSWNVTVSEGMYAVLEFLDLDVEPAPNCIYDYIWVVHGAPDDVNVLALVCGSDLPNNVSSPTNQLHVIFRSDYTVTGRGFSILVHESSTPGPFLVEQPACPGPHEVDAQDGYILSSGYNMGGYNNDELCSWRVTAPQHLYVLLQFITMDIEDSEGCAYDRLVLHDGYDDTASFITYCGTALPPDFTSTGHVVYLTFTSDWLITGAGFYIKTDVADTPGHALPEDHLAACPGPVHVTELTTMEILSPYFGLQNYPNSIECSWHIEAPQDQYVHLYFVAFDLEDSPGCSSDALRIYDGPLQMDLLRARLCGEEPVDEMTSISNSFLLKFTSDYAFTLAGFKIQATAVDIQGTLPPDFAPPSDPCPGPDVFGPEIAAGVVETVNFGVQDYSNSAYCTWLIHGYDDQRIHIHFTDMAIEGHSSCNYDSLKVYDGDHVDAPLLGIYCGDTLPDDIISDTSSTLLVFSSDWSISDAGFRAEFQKVSELTNVGVVSIGKDTISASNPFSGMSKARRQSIKESILDLLSQGWRQTPVR